MNSIKSPKKIKKNQKKHNFSLKNTPKQATTAKKQYTFSKKIKKNTRFQTLFVNKRYLLITIILTILPLLSPGITNAETLYISPNGSDNNPGTIDKPLKTIQKTRNSVAKIIETNPKEPITILLRGGIYQIDQTIEFTPEDSGTTESAITYKAYPGENPIISAGSPITGWENAKNNRWTTKIPDVAQGKWYFRQLYADGQRLNRTRYPKKGLLKIKSVDSAVKTIEFDQEIPFKDLGHKDEELIVIQNWSIARSIIESSNGSIINAKTPLGWVGHGWTTASSGKPAYLENAIEFLDTPREWHLDRKTGILTYLSKNNENPNDKTFIAPRIEKLLSIKGTVDNPVRNLRFHGITFQHSKWNLPPGGYAGIQAGFNGTKNKPNTEPEQTLPVAIELQYALDCEFERCTVTHTGASGIGIGAGCLRNMIVGCEISDIGGNGIHIGLPKGPVVVLDQDWDNEKDIPVGNEVSNCYIHHCAAESYGAVGLFAAFSKNTRISHNHVAFMPYTGISIGFRWNTTSTSQSHCIVEYNHIHDVMIKIADGGGIYTLGLQPGTILRGNHIYNVYRSSYAHGGAPNNGIFFDEGSMGFLVEDNVIYNTSGKSIRFNQNKSEWHTWRDNSFGPKPDQKNFPKTITNMAGIQHPYKNQ